MNGVERCTFFDNCRWYPPEPDDAGISHCGGFGRGGGGADFRTPYFRWQLIQFRMIAIIVKTKCWEEARVE